MMPVRVELDVWLAGIVMHVGMPHATHKPLSASKMYPDAQT
jgi:hypothetical protein